MKQILLILGIVITFAACSKKSDSTPQNSTTPLVFTSLVATDTVVKVNDVTSITANATGEGLTYTWTADFGTFIGSGSVVQWTVCHSDKFTINCKITDKNNNSASRDVVVRTIN